MVNARGIQFDSIRFESNMDKYEINELKMMTRIGDHFFFFEKCVEIIRNPLFFNSHLNTLYLSREKKTHIDFCVVSRIQFFNYQNAANE